MMKSEFHPNGSLTDVGTNKKEWEEYSFKFFISRVAHHLKCQRVF